MIDAEMVGSYTIYAELPKGVMVNISPHANPTVVYAPDFPVKPMEYDVWTYPAMDGITTACSFHQMLPKGHTPFKARRRSEVESALPAVYLITCLRPATVLPTTVVSISRNRASQLNLNRLRPDTLSKQGLTASMMFRSSHLVVHQVPSLITMVSVANIGERLHSVLTSI